jgi:succinate dehydrogenase / fumarate reductase, cytochrome b subunit
MADAKRPISPHLSVYRWQISNSLSILHRATGVMMSIGGVVLTLWLLGVAAGPDSYLMVVDWLGSPLGLLLLLGWSYCFFFHLSNGVRHLFWDAGYGFDLPRARASGVAVIVISAALTVGFWMLVLAGAGG